jgi:hypothetical protein
VRTATAEQPDRPRHCRTWLSWPAVIEAGTSRSACQTVNISAHGASIRTKARLLDGFPLTSGIDERSDAARTTLICWLLVLTVVISAEFAWVLWLQGAWTVAPAAAGPRPHPFPGALPAPGVD